MLLLWTHRRLLAVCISRLKDVIIIDGLNHYPQDIELTLEESHPALRPGCSAAFSCDVGEEERLIVLAEVYVDRQGLDTETMVDLSTFSHQITRAIKRAIATQRDLDPYDIILIQPRTIPKTSSGKIQRHVCRADYLADSYARWPTADSSTDE